MHAQFSPDKVREVRGLDLSFQTNTEALEESASPKKHDTKACNTHHFEYGEDGSDDDRTNEVNTDPRMPVLGPLRAGPTDTTTEPPTTNQPTRPLLLMCHHPAKFLARRRPWRAFFRALYKRRKVVWVGGSW